MFPPDPTAVLVVTNTVQILQHHRNPKRLLYYSDVKGKDKYTVTYDNRSFIVDGSRTLLLSGSVHYPRSTPGMWDDILQKMVQDGLNMVEIYIFWNLHEFKQGQEYNFAGSANWMLFVEKAAAAGLFVNLRIGPYVCAEWNYGKGREREEGGGRREREEGEGGGRGRREGEGEGGGREGEGGGRGREGEGGGREGEGGGRREGGRGRREKEGGRGRRETAVDVTSLCKCASQCVLV